MNDGWICLHRKLLDNPIVTKDTEYFAVWVYLLLNATHKERDVLFRGERITLQAGQLLAGRKSIASELKVNESKVKRILIDFEKDNQIERQRSNKNSLITIVNWQEYQNSFSEFNFGNLQKVTTKATNKMDNKKYSENVENIRNNGNLQFGSDQQNDHQSDQQVTNKWTANDQQVTTNNNETNKQSNNETNISPKSPRGEKRPTAVSMIRERGFSETIENELISWTRYKKEKHQPYKETGFKAFLTRIENVVNEYGDDAVVEVIENSMAQNYQGVVFDWLKDKPKITNDVETEKCKSTKSKSGRVWQS